MEPTYTINHKKCESPLNSEVSLSSSVKIIKGYTYSNLKPSLKT